MDDAMKAKEEKGARDMARCIAILITMGVPKTLTNRAAPRALSPKDKELIQRDAPKLNYDYFMDAANEYCRLQNGPHSMEKCCTWYALVVWGIVNNLPVPCNASQIMVARDLKKAGLYPEKEACFQTLTDERRDQVQEVLDHVVRVW
jgi:hypothetical protein